MAKTKVPKLIPDAINPLRQMRVVGRLVRKAVKKPGSAPGTLIHTGMKKVERIRITYLDYDLGQLSEGEVEDIRKCFPLKDSPTVSWINVDGLHDVDLVRTIGEQFGWHPLLLEDIVGVGQRAKVEEYDGYVFAVLPMLSWDPERLQLVEEQLSLVMGERYVFTFQERIGDVFEPVRERLRQAFGRIRGRGADYLAYALVDAVVDHYFHVLERVGTVVEDLEEQVLRVPEQRTMIQLHELKREIITVRRAVWPVRDAVSVMVRDEGERFAPETRVFLRDVHDHAVHVSETVESLRELVSGAVDLYLSLASHRSNETMKVLTIMASIFIPLTFFAGIYGMNFEYMPELAVPWAYPVLLGAMAVMAAGMVYFFRRKGWL